ncbi:hypothetical protein [Burkholderia ubonensis]|uniref:Uncharacterized protein n=1 Tax=Burkholderia ubonensis subsp. mesacidophila TaxID=265293 RepID=A0A2A4FBQ9_9BURK|nr:hypothetical protein [Burkholderia ubonensis]PCE30048.1 hypothetical protein BZL54_23065 [Burkholderia ubonensis subsp. mesacidophila]
MLAPHSVRLYFDPNDAFRCEGENTAQVDAYIRAMRVVQQRTGATPRSALNNCAPVHIESFAGPLTVLRVSGTPRHHDPAHDPIALSACEQALFMKRGDHFTVSAERDDVQHAAYIALDYAISPNLIVSGRPIALRNPVDTMAADPDATRLLEIVQQRELSSAEQFVASRTMPGIWQRLGGSPVAAITNPTVHDAAECYEFAQHFTDPYQRIRTLSQLTAEWAQALLGSSRRDHAESIPAPAVEQPRRMRM